MITFLKKTFQTIFIYFVLGFLITVNSQQMVTAAWSSHLLENTAICTTPGQQSSLQIVSDGAGGAIIAWEDTRNVHFDIYAQRIDAHGNVLWIKDGIPVCAVDNAQNSPCIATDGAGGAVIIWQDFRTNYADLCAQRINKNGELLWAKDAVLVCGTSGSQSAPVVVNDGVGGVIVVWQDFRRTYADIYAQRVDGSGKTAWERSGIALCNAPGHESFPVITGNGAEGAIVAWVDTRNGNNDVFAQQ